MAGFQLTLHGRIWVTAEGLAQQFGFHSIPWLGIPAVMVTLWSVGLILNSWRDQ